MNLPQYIEIVNKRIKSGISREHAYRADLEGLIRELVPNVDITNEPSSVTDCGNPDYVITKGKIPIGFIEAKDVGKDLNHKQFKPQFDRYRKALDNLIITDYLWFQFYQNGVLVHEIRIAEMQGEKLTALPDNFTEFTNLIQNFCTYVSQTIKSPKRLAELMAAKARLLENILENAITSDEETEENSSLKQQYKTFQDILIHDLTPQGFADIYAQTLAYGMFAARLHDTTLDTFSRQEAAELIPKSNPFLRKLFNHVAGVDIDERIETTVDNLAEVFRATNVDELLKNFGKSTQTQDPIIHFYETFLAEYDPKLRKSHGVWYTPEPVVKFIVRSVDEILKTEFNLKDGLADTTKTKIKFKTDQPDRRTKSGYVEIDKEVHKVQVLDPATGTGTFLAEVVKFIYQKKFKAMQGAWSGYVEEHLIPRLNGFELLMASYSMAHLKLDMLLAQTGYKATKNQRFNIFLTNSLEEHHPDTGTLFSSWLSSEANEANTIKRDAPVMVVMGNPPYSVSSNNKGKWIEGLMADYKKDLKEKNIQPLSDDYIKFIRYGQYFIEKNGEGVLAYISNNSFLNGIIHRKMRKSLVDCFDKIYVVDLHGNSKKKEKAKDGSKDDNVFDITQGVSISFFIKKKDCTDKKVSHIDVYGRRSSKYDFLNDSSIYDISWNEVDIFSPNYLFKPQDRSVLNEYKNGFSINELFPVNSSGIKTHRDSFVVDIDPESLATRLKVFFDKNVADDDIRKDYKLKDNRDWDMSKARANSEFKNDSIVEIDYRPLDVRQIYYNSNVIDFDRFNVMKHMLSADNIGISYNRQVEVNRDFYDVFIHKNLFQLHTLSLKESNSFAPLYCYEDNGLLGNSNKCKVPNLNTKIISKISSIIEMEYVEQDSDLEDLYAPIDILDYVYAILYSPRYRKKYNDCLKSDYPRIKYPSSKEMFLRLSTLGREMRQIHLLESDVVVKYITSYPIDGGNTITRKIVKKDWELCDTKDQLGRIWINDEQYFDQIPLKAWEFYIGGYQPAQKWLKDRKGRKLNFDDILHYQKIIVSLVETDRIMQEIDKIDFM
ncbi:MAG: N-6 DNA methylase [Woeseiaceae bacterium]